MIGPTVYSCRYGKLKAAERAQMQQDFEDRPDLNDLRIRLDVLTPQIGAILYPTFRNLVSLDLMVVCDKKGALHRLLRKVNHKQLREFKIKIESTDDPTFNRILVIFKQSQLTRFCLEIESWNNSKLRELMGVLPTGLALQYLRIGGKKFNQISRICKNDLAETVISMPSLSTYVTHINLTSGAIIERFEQSLIELTTTGKVTTTAAKPKKMSEIPAVTKERRMRKAQGEEAGNLQEMLTAQLKKKSTLGVRGMGRYKAKSRLSPHAVDQMNDRSIKKKTVLRTLERGVMIKKSGDTERLVNLQKRVTVIASTSGLVITAFPSSEENYRRALKGHS